MIETDGKKIETLIKKIITLFPNLPFKSLERNKLIRHTILKTFLSSFLTDDERAEYLGLPEGCRVREGAKFFSQENLKIGPYCWIGENAILDASGGLEIGCHTSIGLSVFIWSHSSHLANLEKKNVINSKLIQKKSTNIGSRCFIGGPSVIMPGVTIGDMVVVKPFSRVEKNIPDRSIVDGHEIKVGVLSDQIIERMKRKA